VPNELYAVPNGGLRTKATAGKLKAQGLRAGVPDLQIDVPRGRYHGLRMELKTPQGRPTPEQNLTIDRLVKRGYYAVVAYGFDEAVRHIRKYFTENF
jgi:hypothetical protein